MGVPVSRDPDPDCRCAAFAAADEGVSVLLGNRNRSFTSSFAAFWTALTNRGDRHSAPRATCGIAMRPLRLGVREGEVRSGQAADVRCAVLRRADVPTRAGPERHADLHRPDAGDVQPVVIGAAARTAGTAARAAAAAGRSTSAVRAERGPKTEEIELVLHRRVRGRWGCAGSASAPLPAGSGSRPRCADSCCGGGRTPRSAQKIHRHQRGARRLDHRPAGRRICAERAASWRIGAQPGRCACCARRWS